MELFLRCAEAWIASSDRMLSCIIQVAESVQNASLPAYRKSYSHNAIRKSDNSGMPFS